MNSVEIAALVADPAAIALGRLPIAPGLAPYDEFVAAIGGSPSPCVLMTTYRSFSFAISRGW